MAKRIYKNPYVLFNSFQLKSFLRDLTLEYDVDEKDAASLADSTFVKYPGLYNWRITGKVMQDFTQTTGFDDNMFALVGDTTAKAIEIRPSDSSVGASNPKFTGTGFLVKYPPMAGSVGDLHEADFEIAPASDLTRSTS